MADYSNAFEALLYDKLIPEFCADKSRRCDAANFVRSSVKVSEEDAAYFLKAWEDDLIQHAGRGIYRTAKGAAGEQFFWEGMKSKDPRPFSLWLEPIITVAGLARLHFDYGWPAHLIATQSIDWAFDLVAFHPESEGELIACEVKKTATEVDQLISLMEQFCANPSQPEPPSGKARNAFKKVSALRARKAPIFWALGPNGYSRIFRTVYGDDGRIRLNPVSSEQLHFRNAQMKTTTCDQSLSVDSLRERVMRNPIGGHSMRLWRVAENISDHAKGDTSDDRLLHLMSRIGVLSRGMATELRSGQITQDEVAELLDQLAELGEISFDEWLRHKA